MATTIALMRFVFSAAGTDIYIENFFKAESLAKNYFDVFKFFFGVKFLSSRLVAIYYCTAESWSLFYGQKLTICTCLCTLICNSSANDTVVTINLTTYTPVQFQRTDRTVFLGTRPMFVKHNRSWVRNGK